MPKTFGELVTETEREQFIPFPAAHVCSLLQKGRGKAWRGLPPGAGEPGLGKLCVNLPFSAGWTGGKHAVLPTSSKSGCNYRLQKGRNLDISDFLHWQKEPWFFKPRLRPRAFCFFGCFVLVFVLLGSRHLQERALGRTMDRAATELKVFRVKWTFRSLVSFQTAASG